MKRSVACLHELGVSPTLVPTTGPNTATDLARSCLQQGADLILAAGGDGTINEVVNGMVHSGVPLGILPGGTANVLAMELGIGGRMEKAAALIGTCEPARISIGLLEASDQPPRHFILMTGVGLDAHIVYHMNAPIKASLGKVAYWIGGFAQLGRRFPEFDAVVDGRTHRVSFALASRVRNYGGDLEIARNASLLDHHFETVLFEGSNSFSYLKYFWGILRNNLESKKGVTTLRAGEVRFLAPEDSRIYLQVDGENGGHLPASIRMVPDALTLLTPPHLHARYGRPAQSAAQWTTSPTR